MASRLSLRRQTGGGLRTRCDGKFSAPAGQQEALRDGSPQPGGGSGEAAVEEPGSPLRRRPPTLNATPVRFLWPHPVCPQDGAGDYMQFLRSSHQEALKEEERRHRFVAEKHCSLIQSIADIMNKVHGSQNFSWQYIDFFCFFSLLIDSGSKFSSAFSRCSLGPVGGCRKSHVLSGWACKACSCWAHAGKEFNVVFVYLKLSITDMENYCICIAVLCKIKMIFLK